MNVHRNGFHHRNVVCIFNPAVVFGVGLKSSCELGWAPTVDWVPYKLTSADQDGENDQQKHAVDMVHTVDPVIAPT